jgi:uncharacterized protein (DUF4415 family)
MYQVNEKLVQAHQKSMESVHALSQLALENTQSLAQIHYDATKEMLATVQEKSAEILKLKDPKEIMTMFSAHALQEASAGVVAYQAKVNSVLRKSHHELIEMTDSAIEHAKERLNDLVNEASAKAPTGSEAFTASFKAAFEAALQGFDQVRSSVHTAYANLEKSADSALNSNEHVVQTATKARKAIAAS